MTINQQSEAVLFAALGEPSRLAIVRHLFTGEHSVAELRDHLGLAQSTVSKHLAVLRECGLAEVRAQGRSSIYRLANPTEVTEILDAVTQLVEAK